MFDSMLHNNTISNIDKFDYLLFLFNGSPLSRFRCKPLSSSKYLVAFNAFRKPYDNKRAIAVSH